ncbi:MAG: hypothetical protein M3Q07_28565 [Pseudobdellovibrionaceae bacterium]|nr:hypothetical protein [Pseudobdellovibrionaceae bacterium]
MSYEAQSLTLGYHPFVQLSPLEYLTFLEIHGRWVFDDLLSRLRDPCRIHREWAICFCGAAAEMPREMLESSTDIHALVTSSETFKDRKRHLRAFQRVFFCRVWKRVKAGTLPLEGEATDVVRQDYERWLAYFARRESEVREKRRKPSQISKKAAAPKKENEPHKAPAPVVIRSRSPEPKSTPAARNVWRNPRSCEPLSVKRRI